MIEFSLPCWVNDWMGKCTSWKWISLSRSYNWTYSNDRHPPKKDQKLSKKNGGSSLYVSGSISFLEFYNIVSKFPSQSSQAKPASCQPTPSWLVCSLPPTREQTSHNPRFWSWVSAHSLKKYMVNGFNEVTMTHWRISCFLAPPILTRRPWS